MNSFTHCVHLFVLPCLRMEVILDELRENEVDIDMETLSYHINECLDRYKSAFQSLPIESFDLAILFHKIGVLWRTSLWTQRAPLEDRGII